MYLHKIKQNSCSIDAQLSRSYFFNVRDCCIDMQNSMKFYSSHKYTYKTLPCLYASQISYLNKQDNDMQILATFDSRKIRRMFHLKS